MQTLFYRLFALRKELLHPLERLVLAVSLLLGLCAFLVSVRDVQRFAGIDLRNRVVGARVMLAGINPYTHFWQPGMPLEWLDPAHDWNKHRLTVPPTALWFYAPLAPLPYRSLRTLSCLLEWAALVASLALLCRLIDSHRLRVLFLASGTLFIILSDIWRMHVERGQVYVFHLLALSAGALLTARGHSLAAGLAFGCAALLRLNLLVIGPALIAAGRWRSGLASLATFGVGFLVTLPFVPGGTWKGYLDVGNHYYIDLYDPDSLPRLPPPQHQGLVESYNFDEHLPDITSNSLPVLYQILQTSRGLPLLDLGLVCKALLAMASLLLLATAFLGRKTAPPATFLMLVVLTWALALEYFFPQRWAYVDIVLLLPLALSLSALFADASGSLSLRHPLATFLMFTGLVLGLCMTTYLGLYWTTLLRSWLVMGAALAAGLFAFFSHPIAEHDAPRVKR